MPSPPSRPYIGGQAVLEGVMMRAPASFAVVVRRRDGSLHVRERAMHDRPRGLSRWPLLRGIATLVESLRLGGEALRFSAEHFEEDLEAGEASRAGTPGGSGTGILGALGLALLAQVTRADGEGVAGAGAKSSGGRSWVMLAVAIAFFVALPQAVAAALNRVLHLGLEVQSAPFQAMTGALKLAVVIGYLVAIRRIPEIRRVFQYHGAEHKTISTYEAGEALVVENARKKTTLHPRCGTTFLVMVAIVSILVFMAVGAMLPRIHTGSALLDNALFFLEKLPFLPVLVAITFELQRLFSRYCTTGPLRVLLVPGFLVQRITTSEPDDAQLEVALGSLRVTLFRQEQGAAGATEDDVAFPSYEALLAAPRLRAETAPARAA
ncbi:MAG TPA: DUF1385 domain-containing protein [Polyangiaceae bacterium]|jgi:uncharacterized protein YqhQ|nr:DUF1385 domain-containing protein [Polyangiaceae bacterium]